MGMKEPLMPRLSTFIRAHGSSQARIGRSPLALKPAPMRPDGHGQEGTRTHPFRNLWTTIHPEGPKESTRGMHPSAKTLRPWGSIDSSKRRAGAPLRGLCPGMRPHGLRDQLRGVQRSTSKAADVAVFATVIDGESRTRALARHAQSARKGSKRARTDASVQGESGTRSRARSS
jgi:hypothetical protein